MTNSITTKIIFGRKGFLLLMILSLVYCASFANKIKKSSPPDETAYIKAADDEWNQNHLSDALALYEKALSINSKNCWANYRVGLIKYMTDPAIVSSMPYFESSISNAPHIKGDTIIDCYYYLGNCYMLEGQYDSAAMAFKLFGSHLVHNGEMRNVSNEINNDLMDCQTAPGILKRSPDSASYYMNGKSQPVTVRNVSAINSQYPEYAEVVYDNDSEMIFTSRRPASQDSAIDPFTEKYYEDIFYSIKDANGNWTAPTSFTKTLGYPASLHLNVASIAISNDQNTLYVFYDGSVVQYTKKDGKWANPTYLTKEVKDLGKKHVPSVFVSNDGSTMIYSSDISGGYGGKDLYMCTREKGGKTWSTPKNLGNVVNTSGDEDAPYLLPDNKTLFFSSTGHGGLGGYDIFVTYYNDGKWSTPENLGAPINSSGNDVFFTYNEATQKGYFSSSRLGGQGDLDIYSFTINQAKVIPPPPPVVVAPPPPPPVAPPPAPAPVVANENYVYTVITGCFMVKQHATNMINRLRKDHLVVSIISNTTVNGQYPQGLYMVGFGHFKTHQEAAQARDHLRKDLVKDAWIKADKVNIEGGQ